MGEKTLIGLLENCPKNQTIGDNLVRAWSKINSGKYKKIVCAISGGSDSDVMLDIIWQCDKDSKTILHEVRQIIGMAQIPMSEKLGVNIKKYRMLEKEQAYPDAELLLRIYEETGCKPSLLLGIAHIEERIISDLWNQIAPDVQKKILPLVEQVVWFLKS